MFNFNNLAKIGSSIVRNKWKYGLSAALTSLILKKLYDRTSENTGFMASEFINSENKTPKIKNLVFAGGGAKGTAHVGALKMLKIKLGSLDDVDRVAGTSAGAIVASLLCVGYEPDEMEKLLIETDFSKLFLGDDHGATKGIPKGGASGEDFTVWLDDLICSKVTEIEKPKEKGRYKNLTLGELRELREGNNRKRYKHLHMILGIINPDDSVRLCNYGSESDHNSSFVISSLVRGSASIPYVLCNSRLKCKDEVTKIITEVKEYVVEDGGLKNETNYPIGLFDFNKYASFPYYDKLPYEEVPNHETLGFNFYDGRISNFKKVKRILDAVFLAYGGGLKPWWVKEAEAEKVIRTIMIDTREVGATDFGISKERKASLIIAGSDAVRDYWNTGNIKKHCNDQQKQLDEKKRIKDKILAHFRSRSNLKKPSDDHIKSGNVSKLNERFQSQSFSQILISGIGGSGKTSLITGYLYDEYFEDKLKSDWKKGELYQKDKDDKEDSRKKSKKIPPMVWMLEENNDNYVSSFLMLYRKLFNDRTPAKDNLVQEVFDELGKNSSSSWILVFDDFQDREYAKKFFQNFENGTVVAVSRDPSVVPSAHKFCIASFDKKDCSLLIENIANAFNERHGYPVGIILPNDKELTKIMDLSGGLPLYLKVMISRIYKDRISYKNYFDSIEKYDGSEITDADKNLGITKTQCTIILEGINAIKSHPAIDIHRGIPLGGEDAYHALQLCSYFGQREIFEELTTIVNGKKRFSINEVYSIIEKTSLMQEEAYNNCHNGMGRLYKMHSIVQRLVRNKDNEKKMHVQEALNNLVKLASKNTVELSEPENEKNKTLVFNHISVACFHGDKFLIDPKIKFQVARLLNIKAYLCTQNGKVKLENAANISFEAKRYCDEIANISDKEDISAAELYAKLSKTRLDQNDQNLLPMVYASILYTYGRMVFYGANIDKEDAKKFLSMSKELSKLIEKKTGKKIFYEILADRSGLLYFTNKETNSVKELYENIAAYKALLNQKGIYHTEEGQKVNIEIDLYHKHFCCMQILKAITLLNNRYNDHRYDDDKNEILSKLELFKNGLNGREISRKNLHKGKVYLNDQNWDMALLCFEKVLNNQKKKDYLMADAHYGLALIMNKTNKLGKAKEHIEECLKIREDLYEDWHDEILETKKLRNQINGSYSHSERSSEILYQLQNQSQQSSFEQSSNLDAAPNGGIRPKEVNRTNYCCIS